MKKVILTSLTLLLCVSLAIAESDIGFGIKINIDPLGYMNHMDITQRENKTEVDKTLKDALEAATGTSGGSLWVEGDGKQKDLYSAYALGLNVQYSYFYLSLGLGLPTKIYSHNKNIVLINDETYKAGNKIGGTTILDIQIGGGVPLMQDEALNFFVGGGLSVNYVHVKRDIKEDSKFVTLINNILQTKDPSASIKTISEHKNIWQAGLGVKVDVNYDFLDNVGLNLSLSDSVHFIKLYNQTVYAGQLKTGNAYKYSFSDNTKDKDDGIKYKFSNNFIVRAGINFKF